MNSFRATLRTLPQELHFYILGVLCLLLWPFQACLEFPWYWLFVTFFSIGFLCWFVNLAERFNSTIIGKSISGVLFLAGATVNTAIASSALNVILMVPASPFVYTLTVISIFILPVTLSVIALICMIFMTMLAFYYSEEKETKNFIFTELLSIIGRIVAIGVIVSILSAFLKNHQAYLNVTSNFARWFAYNLEMERFSYCKLQKGEKLLYITDTRVIVGKKVNDSYVFSVKNCEVETSDK